MISVLSFEFLQAPIKSPPCATFISQISEKYSTVMCYARPWEISFISHPLLEIQDVDRANSRAQTHQDQDSRTSLTLSRLPPNWLRFNLLLRWGESPDWKQRALLTLAHHDFHCSNFAVIGNKLQSIGYVNNNQRYFHDQSTNYRSIFTVLQASKSC